MIVLAIGLPSLILGWAVFISLGAVIAFSVYAVLAGRREEKEYKNTALPGQEMMAELTRDDNVDEDSFEAIDLDAMNRQNAPLPTPDLSSPSLPEPVMPGPGMPPLPQPGDDTGLGQNMPDSMPLPTGQSGVMNTLDSLISTSGEGNETAGFYDDKSQQSNTSTTGQSMPGNPFMMRR